MFQEFSLVYFANKNSSSIFISSYPCVRLHTCPAAKRFSSVASLHLYVLEGTVSRVTREDAYCGTGGIFIRDKACDTACSLWFNELWPNQGQNHTPYHTAYSKIWRMILGRMHALKCTKSVVNHFKNPIEAMVMKEKRLPQITLSLLDWNCQ